MANRVKSKKSMKFPEDYSAKEWAKLWNLDADEMEIEKAIMEGKLKPSRNQEKEKMIARQAARNFMRKNARLNIRLNEYDLSRLKIKAAQEGLPYQTLAASIIHKYVSGAPNYRMEG